MVAPVPPPPGDPLLLHGEEAYLIDRDARRWLAWARRLSLIELDVEILEQPARLEGVRRSLTEVPFLAERRFVLLRDPPQLADRVKRGADSATELAELIAQRAPTTSLCVVAHNRVAPQNPVLAAVRAAGGRVVEQPRYRLRDQRTWLDRAIAERRLRMPRAAVEHLLRVSGGDLGVLDGELAKLASFAQGRPLTVQDVQRLAAGSEHVEMWDIVDRLLSVPHGRGPAAVDALLAEGAATPQLTAVLGGQLREVLQAHELVAGGVPGASSLAARLGLPPWRAERLLRWVAATTPEMVEGWLRALQWQDAEMKQGRLDDVSALRSLMLRAAREAAERSSRSARPAGAR